VKRSAIVALGLLLSAPSWAAGAGHSAPSPVIASRPSPHEVIVPPTVQTVAPNAATVPLPSRHEVIVPPTVDTVESK
jgi:hypothetical protein